MRRPLAPATVLLLALGCVSLAALGCASMGAYQGITSPVSHLDLRLDPCPQSPNCVSSQAWDPAQRVPAFSFAGSGESALAALVALVEADPAATIVERRSGIYVRAEYVSRWLRFTDDLELLVDEEAGLVHVRSASRRGWSDLGVNRRRVEALHEAYGASMLPLE